MPESISGRRHGPEPGYRSTGAGRRRIGSAAVWPAKRASVAEEAPEFCRFLDEEGERLRRVLRKQGWGTARRILGATDPEHRSYYLSVAVGTVGPDKWIRTVDRDQPDAILPLLVAGASLLTSAFELRRDGLASTLSDAAADVWTRMVGEADACIQEVLGPRSRQRRRLGVVDRRQPRPRAATARAPAPLPVPDRDRTGPLVRPRADADRSEPRWGWRRRGDVRLRPEQGHGVCRHPRTHADRPGPSDPERAPGISRGAGRSGPPFQPHLLRAGGRHRRDLGGRAELFLARRLPDFAADTDRLEQTSPSRSPGAISTSRPGACLHVAYAKGVEERIPDVARAEPDSTLPLLIRSARAVYWAWDARGGGTADTVSQEQWKVWFQRLRLPRTASTR